MTLLNGALEARGKVLLKLNVDAEPTADGAGVLPSAKSPTVSELAGAAATPSRAWSRSHDQPRHPCPQGCRRDRSARDPDRQDRPLTRWRVQRARGTVTEFDEYVGLGEVDDGGRQRYLFHCVEIADGTRTIEVGTEVDFDVCAKFGRDEAAGCAR